MSSERVSAILNPTRTFQIPMRGNELTVEQLREAHDPFQIPMRGNEYMKTEGSASGDMRFQIPMRGNE